jgi:hypothetical protein
MKYRRKPVVPVVIDALQFKVTNGIGNHQEITDFVDQKLTIVDMGDSIIIPTLEGDMKCSLNDYIIKGINGEFYPCKPNIFEKTYELIEK